MTCGNRKNIVEDKIIIAGPCAAESREQVLSIAKSLAAMGVTLFRAGVWKPRTSPASFEGAGAVALDWLKEVQEIDVETPRETCKMKVAVEVANKEHVELALDAGISLLWIGSRTSSNPFATQEIADAIKNSDKSVQVLIKNPLTPDLRLWSGATERIKNAGVADIILVHRGFPLYDRSLFRNTPLWNIALQMKNFYPTLPMLCDPSHIGGKSDYVEQIATQAIELGFEGLMVEVHDNPSAALSDAPQQITPQEFAEMLARLTRLTKQTESAEKEQNREISDAPLHNIALLREEIDQIDDKILSLLQQRTEIAKKIGDRKRERGLPLFQSERYKTIIEQRIENGTQKGLSKSFVKSLMELIHSESLEKQIGKEK